MKHLRRRIQEINASHPQYQGETPLVLVSLRAAPPRPFQRRAGRGRSPHRGAYGATTSARPRTSRACYTPISLTDARTGRRGRLRKLPAGAALVPILHYCYQRGHLMMYVNGSMPLALRSAAEEDHTQDEVWLVATPPTGIQEIGLTDCRRAFHLLLPDAA